MITAVFITFKKSLDPHKLRLHLTPKAFFFDAFQKLPSGNTGPTHTVTHMRKGPERYAADLAAAQSRGQLQQNQFAASFLPVQNQQPLYLLRCQHLDFSGQGQYTFV